MIMRTTKVKAPSPRRIFERIINILLGQALVAIVRPVFEAVDGRDPVGRGTVQQVAWRNPSETGLYPM
jgi:hypothetical protein